MFDSGRGGVLAVRCLREKLPRADIAFYADRKHAPYGTKTEAQLLPLIEQDMDRLKSVGACRILSACCTASSLFDKLPDAYRDSIFPIIQPTVNYALQLTKNRRIGVLATEATVRSHVFKTALQKAASDVSVSEIPAQKLVALAEAGRTAPDDVEVKITCRMLRLAFGDFGMDTLILGCTHFPLFTDAMRAEFSNVSLVSSVEAGVSAFVSTLTEREKEGDGRIFCLS